MMATIFNGASDPVDRYPVGVARRLEYPDFPAWALMERAACLEPGRLACVYHDVEWTWEELNLDAVRCAAALRRLGIRPGDRVGILLPNIPEYLIALNGIWRAGAIAVALSPMAVQEEVDRLLASTECRLVICLDMLSELISGPHRPDKALFVSLRPRLPLFEQLGYLVLRKRRTGHWWLAASEHVGWFWDELAINTDSTEISREAASERRHDWSKTPAYILPTGGTTGEPKAVTLSHRNMVANAWQQYHWAGATTGQETLLALLPFFHSYGLSTNVLGGAAMAATLIMDHRFNPRKTLQLIETHRPTVFHTVPAMLVALNEQLRNRTVDLSSLKWIISGGASLPEAVGQEFAKHSKAIVVEGYGLSECSPVTHVGPLDGTAPAGCIGLPLPDTDCRIVDSETGERDVSFGDVGELLVRGPQVMLGYWDSVREKLVDGEVTDTDPNRWLPTGDLARQTPEGYFKIVERKKDLIITSGFNVYPQEVESVLKRHPAVKDAAVVGVPDEHRGELVKAFVVLNAGFEWDESALSEHCKAHLSAHKRPRSFEHCDDLPRSFLGKVIRRKLKES
ncbi:MAG: AMP-binding protein [Planctomycetaceae bacterium]